MILLATALAASAPDAAPADPTDPALRLHASARKVELRHMAVLGSWSAVNLVGGTVGYFTADKPRLQGFHATNAAWNTVNAALAIGGLLGGKKTPSSLEAVQKRNRGLRRTLGINLGLDCVYVASGVSTVLLARHLDRPMLQGVGESIILQGAFLAGFDLVFLDTHRNVDRQLQVAMTPGGLQLSGTW